MEKITNCPTKDTKFSRNKGDDRKIIRGEGKDIIRSKCVGGRRMPYWKWRPPKKKAGRRSLAMPLIPVMSACVFFSCLHISRITFAVISLICSYSVLLFCMHASFEQFNRKLNISFHCSHNESEYDCPANRTDKKR